jgi:hypothetical protein
MDDAASIIAQQGEIARRRQLMAAMQGQNMQTGIQGSGRGNTIGQALAKVATAYLLAKNAKELAGEEATNRDQYQQALQGELGSYITTRDGSGPQEMQGPLEPGQEDVPRPMLPGSPGNPREAVVRAMASQFPELQAIGKAEFGGLKKDQMTAKDMAGLAEKFTPQSITAYAQSGNPSVLRLLPKQHVVANSIVNADQYGEQKPTEQGYFGETFGPDERVNGEVIQRDTRSGKAHQVAVRPPSSTVNVIPPAQKVGLEELAKKYAANVAKMGETAQESRKFVGMIDQLGKLTDAGTYSGPLSDAAVWVNRLASSAGIPVDASKLSNSESYASVASEAAQRLIGQFGGNRGLTATEAEQIKQIVPQLQSSPQARYQMSQILRGVAERNMSDYKAAHSNYISFVQTQDPNKIDPTLYGSQMPTETPTPAQPGKPSGKATVSNW